MAATHTIIAAVTFCLVGVYLRWPVMAVETPADIWNFPQTVGVWQGNPDQSASEELTGFGAEGLVSMEYRWNQEMPIDFRLAYFEYQTQGKELTGYRVERFLLGDDLVEQESLSIGGQRVRRIIQRRGNRYRVVLSWYEMHGQSMERSWEVVLQTIYGSVIQRQTNGAVVVIQTDYSNPMELPKAMERLDRFVRAVVPSIKTVLAPAGRI